MTQNSGYTMLAWAALGICWLAALLSFIGRQTQAPAGNANGARELACDELAGVRDAGRRSISTTRLQIEETGGGGADGGIDLRLSKDGKTTLVQCKQWRSQCVDVKIVREMYGLLAHHGADAVKIVAIGEFTPDARRFAQGKPIELVHGEGLLAMIGMYRAHARR